MHGQYGLHRYMQLLELTNLELGCELTFEGVLELGSVEGEVGTWGGTEAMESEKVKLEVHDFVIGCDCVDCLFHDRETQAVTFGQIEQNFGYKVSYGLVV